MASFILDERIIYPYLVPNIYSWHSVCICTRARGASVKLRRYKKHVTCTTCNDKTLDKCYVPKAFEFKCFKMSKLGASDHHSVLLLPKIHRLTDHSNKPKKIGKQIWSVDNISKLQNCLDKTEWSVFLDNPEQTTNYLLYYADQTIPTTTVKQRHDKPWMSNKIRKLLADRQPALRDGNGQSCKQLQREIQHNISELAADIDSKLQSDSRTATLKFQD